MGKKTTTGKKQKIERMKEKKKSVQKSIRKTTKKSVKPLANILKKAAAQRVDLVKAQVKAKQAGKVVSNESFSSRTMASVETLCFRSPLRLRRMMMMILSYPFHLPLVADIFGSQSLPNVSTLRSGSTSCGTMRRNIQT